MVTSNARMSLLLPALACTLIACATPPAQEPPDTPAPVTPGVPSVETPGPHPESGLSRIQIPIAGESFTFEIADQRHERARGLGGRERLGRNEGMIFVYKRPEILGYWMKDCLIDIDIAYVRSDGRIMSVHRMKKEPPPREGERLSAYEDRLPRYSSRHLVQFALEFAPGTLQRLGLKPGQVIQLPRTELLEHAE